jgi:hypothetical protein
VRFFRLVVLLLCGALFVVSLLAQSTNGTISGLVLDPTGRVIFGADVVIVNDATGVKYFGRTNPEGIYVVPNLPPGPYRIQVSKPGFNTLIKPDILLNVQDAVSISFTLPVGAVSETITVQGGAPLVKTEMASVGTVIDRQFVENLPLNGRSFNTLLQLTPGVIIAPSSSAGQYAISGQRTTANNFIVDGVSANFGVSQYLGLNGTGTGTAQAFSAIGGTSSLVSVDALQEFRVETSSFAPEFGRAPGGQVLLTTRSGTNDWHGGAFDYFRNDVMDANDWFANQAQTPRAPERHNDFGAFLGGPIARDNTFFFLSYEGARLRLPKTQTDQVPSMTARTSAPTSVAPFLAAYSVPNGMVSPDGYTAQFTGSYSNSATLNAGSVRLDHKFGDRFSIFGRYNDAPSQLTAPVSGVSSLFVTTVNTRTLTVNANMTFSGGLLNSLRANLSTQSSGLAYTLGSTQTYGAIPLDPSLLIAPLNPSEVLTQFSTLDTTTQYYLGSDGRNRTRQLNLADDLALMTSSHQLKLGVDYRAIYLNETPVHYIVGASGNSVQDLLATGQGSLSVAEYLPSSFVARSLSLYGQDTWQVSSRLVLTYGLRWEWSPAPTPRGNTTVTAWQNVNDPAAISLAPPGASLWSTTYGNFAPRIGLAYKLTDRGDLVLRAGAGAFYDLGLGAASNLGYSFPNSARTFSLSVGLPIGDVQPYLPTMSLQPPYSGVVSGFDPSLQLPRSYQWNVAVEKSFHDRQAITASYVGQAGRRLLRQSALYAPNADFTGDFLLTNNSAYSNYHALQLQYRRPLWEGLQVLANYTWSHSLDNASNDVVASLPGNVISASNDYGSSDFDVRHSFSGALTYQIPAALKSGPISLLTRNWSIDAVLVARSGFPFNGVVILASPDPRMTARSRPDRVPGQPLWLSQPGAPAGKILNAAAFSVPTTPRQGTERRNDIPGLGFDQIDLSVARRFALGERLKLQFRADAFNVFNHPNFTNPTAFVEFGAPFLQSMSMLNQGLGGLNPLFQEGGPRSLQLSFKLTF